jgi:hypothetical protein
MDGCEGYMLLQVQVPSTGTSTTERCGNTTSSMAQARNLGFMRNSAGRDQRTGEFALARGLQDKVHGVTKLHREKEGVGKGQDRGRGRGRYTIKMYIGTVAAW